LHSKAKANIGL